MAQAFAATMSYLLEKLQNLIALQGQETDFVLERSHIVYIAYSNLTLGKIRTDSAHIVNSENRLFFKLLATPYQDVTEQVTEFALRTMTGHIMSNVTHNRPHDTVYLTLIRSDKPGSLSIRLCIPFLINQYSGSLHLRHLVFLGESRTCHQQHDCRSKVNLDTIFFLHT